MSKSPARLRPAFAWRARLRCEPLEDRTQPAGLNPSYNQLVGAPPALSDAAWFAWEADLQAQRLARVPSARANTYYFAQSGNDLTGAGTIDHPWQTLAKAQAVLDASVGDVHLRFQGGDTWRELTVLNVAKDDVTIDSYGDGTAFFTDFTTQYATGWTHVSGDLWKRAELATVGWLREGADIVYPFKHIYTRTNSSTSVAATAYSFYHDTARSDANSAGVITLYLNAGPGVNPNTLAGGFEAAPFAGGWSVTGDNVRLENVRLHGYGMNPPGGGSNYGIYVAGPANAEAVLVGVDVFYTGYHAIGNAGQQANFLTAVGCRAGLCTTDFSGNLTVFVGYSDTGGFEDVWVDNEIGYGALPDFSWGAAPGARAGLGFYDHTAGFDAPALIVALRTRYPDHPWQVAAGTVVGGPVAGRLEDVRAFIVGEHPEAVGCAPLLGGSFGTVALANCDYDYGAPVAPAGQAPTVWLGPSRFWAYNCTFRVDASATYNYGAGFGWFYGYGYEVGPVLVNCRLDMVTPRGEFGSIVVVYNSPLADTIAFQNCVFVFTGTTPAYRGSGALAGAMLNHNAYYTQTGDESDFLAGDAAGVALDQPPTEGTPSLSSPLHDAGQTNSLNYDQAGAARPASSRDIGPLVSRPLPTPAVVTAGWGGRTVLLHYGMTVPAAGIERLSLTFPANVDVHADSLTVVGKSGTPYAYSDFRYDPVTHTATWMLATPARADRLHLSVDGREFFAFGALPGDLTGDGVVRMDDLKRFTAAFGSKNSLFDLNGDGVVNGADLAWVMRYFGARV